VDWTKLILFDENLYLLSETLYINKTESLSFVFLIELTNITQRKYTFSISQKPMLINKDHHI